MTTVTLPKTEYKQLKQQAEAYRKFAARFFEAVLQDPVGEVVEDFRNTNLYSKGFLKNLEKGLRRSSYAKKYGSQTLKRRSSTAS